MGVKLDKVDKHILFELDRNSRIPFTKLAKRVGKSKESVRYRVRKLQERGVIRRFTTWVDPVRLGFRSAKLYLKLANIPAKKEAFREHVLADKRLFWLGIADGAWNAGLSYFVQSNNEFFVIKNELFTKFKDLILDFRVASLVSVHVHEKTFLHDAEAQWLTLFAEGDMFTLDPLSKKILSELCIDARVNIATLALKLKTTVDIIRHRMKKLEQNKIVSKYSIAVDYTKIGYEFYKTFLYFTNLSEKDFAAIQEFARLNPHMIHLVKQISPWDVEFEIMCENYAQYRRIIDQLTEQFSSSITNVETAIMSEDYVFPAVFG